LETEHARQKLNTKTAEPYFLRKGKSGSHAIRVQNKMVLKEYRGKFFPNTSLDSFCYLFEVNILVF
jgi:hypothetical protein